MFNGILLLLVFFTYISACKAANFYADTQCNIHVSDYGDLEVNPIVGQFSITLKSGDFNETKKVILVNKHK